MTSSMTLAVFIDALGWELMRGRPFMDDVLSHRSPLGTVFGYSCTCCPTILTGAMPREHGHLSFWSYAPERSPFAGFGLLGLLPGWLTRRGRVRRVLSRLVARMKGWDGYFQLYNVPFQLLPCMDYLEKRDLYQPGGIVGGVPTVFDALRSARVPFHLSDWRRSEEHNVAALRDDLERGDVRFAYLYLAGLDATLHAEGTGSARALARVRWYEDQLRSLYELASRRYREVRMMVFSDHGMTDVVDLCPLQSRIDGLGLRFGRDYAAMYDSTMARFWFLHAGARDAILGALAEEPRGRVLSRGELSLWEADFEDDRYGEIFFLLQPGVLLCPSFMGETPMAGMHGYAPEHPEATALFASNVPGLSPRRLDDLKNVMLESVGLLERAA